MSAKNAKPNNKSGSGKIAAMLIALAVLILAAVAAGVWFFLSPGPTEAPADAPAVSAPAEPTPTPTAAPAPDPTPTPEASEAPTETPEPAVSLPFEVYEGLVLTDLGNYTGMYMEDGSNEIVSGVMMLILRNDSGADLQLARLALAYTGTVCEFELTNLPAGQSVVLLEKSRQAVPEGDIIAAAAENVVFFSEPMSIHEDIFEISGLDGMLNIKNISDTDIAGDIYIYYKNSSSDLLYGGITYRTRVEGGLAAGEIKQLVAAHYSEGASTITSVTYGK